MLSGRFSAHLRAIFRPLAARFRRSGAQSPSYRNARHRVGLRPHRPAGHLYAAAPPGVLRRTAGNRSGPARRHLGVARQGVVPPGPGGPARPHWVRSRHWRPPARGRLQTSYVADHSGGLSEPRTPGIAACGLVWAHLLWLGSSRYGRGCALIDRTASSTASAQTRAHAPPGGCTAPAGGTGSGAKTRTAGGDSGRER